LKKEAKTFANASNTGVPAGHLRAAARGKRFLVLSFKKRTAFALLIHGDLLRR
jgi:hypothetical protein